MASGTAGTDCAASAVRRRAWRNASKIASGMTSWVASAVSSKSMGKLGCRDNEQCHCPSSRISRRSVQSGNSSAIKVSAASAQAPDSTKRSIPLVFPTLLSTGMRLHAPAMIFEIRPCVGCDAKRTASSNRSSKTAWSDPNDIATSRQRNRLSALPRKMQSQAVKKPDGTD